jgi:uncharacterized protein
LRIRFKCKQNASLSLLSFWCGVVKRPDHERMLRLAARRAAAARPSHRAATMAASGDDWRKNIVASADEARAIAGAAQVVAVLGIKTERHAGQPAFEVAAYLQRDGVKIIPVPVYYPEVTEILGEAVVRELGAAAQKAAIDIVDVFRRPQDVPSHVAGILAMSPRPGCVWLQSGCGNAEAEEALARAGVSVVSDRCLMVDRRDRHGRAAGGPRL